MMYYNSYSNCHKHTYLSQRYHTCQEICDIKSRSKPKSNSSTQNYSNTILDEGQTDQNYTLEQDSSNSAKEGSNGKDGSGDTCSFHSKLCHR